MCAHDGMALAFLGSAAADGTAARGQGRTQPLNARP